MKCKRCKEEMGLIEVGEDDGMIRVLFICECSLKAVGWYNPDIQKPDPLIWG